MYEVVLAELRSRWRDGDHGITRDDIDRWAQIGHLSASKVFDQLSIELACDFHTGFLGWEFADGVANALYSALLEFSSVDQDFAWPEAFWGFYLAFDHSERHGPKDRELTREFLSKHKELFG